MKGLLMKRFGSMVAVMLIAVLALLFTACGQKPLPVPPVAKIEAHVDSTHGVERVDNYFWLRDENRSDPDVIKYLEDENAYTEAVMKHTEEMQEQLFQEIKSRIKEDDTSVPARKGSYYYYSRTEEGKQYPIYCRKQDQPDAAEEILLDANAMAEGKDYFDIGTYSVSPDERLLAYVVDDKGSERFTLKIKNLETGQIFDDAIENVSRSLVWANDNKTIFYLVRDDAWRTFKLYRHTLGQKPENDKLVYHEKDDRFWLGVGKTDSDKYIMLGIGSKLTSEYRFIDADNPTGEFKVIQKREQGIEYDVNHHGDHFYILTNDNAKNFKLMRTPVNRPGKRHWREVIAHNPAVKLENMKFFRDYMVLEVRENGMTNIWVTDLNTNKKHTIAFDVPVYTVELGTNMEFNTDTLRYVFVSLKIPSSTYDYHMGDKGKVMKKQREVLGEFSEDDYVMERLMAPADDGTLVPMSIVYKKGLKKDGSNPVYLYGYGAYGISFDPWFSSSRLSILNRGFIFALAQVRGGGEMGRQWYEDGKYFNKKNSFTDFIACGEYLIEQGYSSSDKLVVSGGSAGGLLVGAALNMRPDLFKAVIASVPFVDVINTMLDETIPLTVVEYEEWGNPNEKDYFDYMLSYSPYDNVSAQDYPDILVTAGLNDPRVQYWEPAKWVAKLRATKTDNNFLLLKTKMGQGHMGASGRYDALRELAFEYAFMFDILGIKL